jgi:excinuclease ABC subunit C
VTTTKAAETRDERRTRIAERIRGLPTEPGCYLMKDRAGTIFYVGKAIDLRARVRSYFSGSDTRTFVDWLDDLLFELDVIVVRNEKEALLLERTLVRQHQPRFNVQLRDDKNFIHLRLQTKPTSSPTEPRRHRYPRVEVVRGPRDERPGVRLFGPYHSATAARATLRVLNRHFQLRTCRDAVIDNRARPCLQYQIGRCPAPCVQDLPDYVDALQDAALFLSGRRTELADRVRARMQQAADAEQYETAARLRDQLAAIGTALDDQAVNDVEGRKNQDVWGVDRKGALLVLARVVVRDGRVQGVEHFDFDRAEFPTEELVASWLGQLYDDVDTGSIPDEILLSIPLGDAEAGLAEVVSERRGRRVELRTPQRGRGGKLVEIAQKNATTTMLEKLRKQEVRDSGLRALQERLGLAVVPRVIECFDISLFQGTDAVASQVCFVDGAPDKSRYRKMNIRTVEGTDDFAMQYEAISRRLRRGMTSASLPDLILVDGGKGQLNVAIAACRDCGVHIDNAVGAGPVPPGAPHVALASVAKARSFTTGGSGRSARRARARPQTPREESLGVDEGSELQASPERLFLPGAKEPLVLRPHTADRFLVEQLRDEAHRFAITGHRNRRSRRTLRSVLDEISGVGPAKRKALLAAFGSAQGVADADETALAAVQGVGASLARRLKQALTIDDAGTDDDDGHDVDGHGVDGHGVDGHGVDGHGVDGHGVDGHGVDGHGVDGHGVDGHDDDEAALLDGDEAGLTEDDDHGGGV